MIKLKITIEIEHDEKLTLCPLVSTNTKIAFDCIEATMFSIRDFSEKGLIKNISITESSQKIITND